MNKKISTPVAFTIIIVLAVILVGGILVYQYWWMPKWAEPAFPSGPLSCEAWYHKIEKSFDDANFCEVDSDCKAVQLGGQYIEFGCYKFVNIATDVDALLKEVREYTIKCAQLIDLCALTPKTLCENKKCFTGPPYLPI